MAATTNRKVESTVYRGLGDVYTVERDEKGKLWECREKCEKYEGFVSSPFGRQFAAGKWTCPKKCVPLEQAQILSSPKVGQVSDDFFTDGVRLSLPFWLRD